MITETYCQFHSLAQTKKTMGSMARINESIESDPIDRCFSEWIKYLDHKNAMIRANVAGGVWTILSSSNWKELQKHLVAAQKEEPYRYVYEEISDALAFIASKESDYRGP